MQYPSSYPGSSQPSQPEPNKIGKYVVYVAIGLLAIAVLFFALRGLGAKCGNHICEQGEGCLSCKSDCKCSGQEYCSGNKCVTPACGNAACETGEELICCVDCGCPSESQSCDPIAKKCVIQGGVPDDLAKQLVEQRVAGNASGSATWKSYSIKTGDDIDYNGKKAKQVFVYYYDAAGKEVLFELYIVNVDQEIFSQGTPA